MVANRTWSRGAAGLATYQADAFANSKLGQPLFPPSLARPSSSMCDEPTNRPSEVVTGRGAIFFPAM
jgi:hypothetical protein